MDEEQQPFMGILSAVAKNDFQRLVSNRLVSDWRETLAMLVAYVNDTESWVALCNDLGVKLAQAGKEHASTLCFICGGNVDKAVALWMRSKKESSVSALQVTKMSFCLLINSPCCIIFANHQGMLVNHVIGLISFDHEYRQSIYCHTKCLVASWP